MTRLRVAVVAVDLSAPVAGRGDEGWTPPPAAGLDAAAALAALVRSLGHRVEVAPVTWSALDRLDRLEADVALPLCDGLGRDGYPGVEVLEALARRGIPCAGADAPFLLLGLDKGRSRARLAARGVPIPRGAVVDHEPLDLAACGPGPWLVKPREAGGSVGIDDRSVAGRPDDLVAAVARTVGVYGAAVVEELLPGPELSVVVLGRPGRALPPAAVAWDDDAPAARRVLTFQAKHDPEAAEHAWWLECPAPLPADVVAGVARTAVAAHDALGGVGHSRVDLRLDAAGAPRVLEVNPDPTLLPTATRDARGLYALALGAAGISYAAHVAWLLEDALSR